MDDAEIHRRRLLSVLEQKQKKLHGDSYLLEVVRHYNHYVLSSTLKNLFNQKGKGTSEFETQLEYLSPDSRIRFISAEDPIEITDKKTIKDCKARLRTLLILEAELEEWNDLARLEDIRKEKDDLISFLMECLTPRGKIRNICDQQIKDYRYVRKAIKRARDVLAKTYPDLAALIDKHLETGIYCIWREVV